MYQIYLIFVYSVIFTTFKGLEIVSGSAIPLQSSSLLVILTRVVVTENSLMLKFYWLTLEISYGISTCDERNSASSSNSFYYR